MTEPNFFLPTIRAVLARAPAILAQVRQHGSPSYLFDPRRAREVAEEYQRSFHAALGAHRAFFAVKSNPARPLLSTLTELGLGLGLDISSPEEARLAREVGAPEVIFSGPAKRTADIAEVLGLFPASVIQIDSFGELQRIESAAGERTAPIRCGIRVAPPSRYAWEKFGIPLNQLGEFWRVAKGCRAIRLSGIQCHRSANIDGSRYAETIAEIAAAIRTQLTPEEHHAIEFIDIGGGFMANLCEAPYTEPYSAQLLDGAGFARPGVGQRTYTPFAALTVPAYSEAIGAAVTQHLRPLVNAEIWTEPGRVLAAPPFSIILTVVDVKAEGVVIVDGGENMVGWDKYLQRYAPIINLTHPAEVEIAATIAGSLCDPDDVWGFRCFGTTLEPGDVLIIPGQGAYTFAHAKRFIRGIPPIITLPETRP